MRAVGLLLALILAGCVANGGTATDLEVASATAEAILAAHQASRERPLLSKKNWEVVLADLEWLEEQTPPCSEVEFVVSRGHMHNFDMLCGRETVVLQVPVSKHKPCAAFLWGSHLVPSDHVRAAVEELAALTRDGGLDSTASVWHEVILRQQLDTELPKLSAHGPCHVRRRWLGGRQYGTYAFECENGGALVRAWVQPDGRISILNVVDEGLAGWAHHAPDWADPLWFR